MEQRMWAKHHTVAARWARNECHGSFLIDKKFHIVKSTWTIPFGNSSVCLHKLSTALKAATFTSESKKRPPIISKTWIFLTASIAFSWLKEPTAINPHSRSSEDSEKWTSHDRRLSTFVTPSKYETLPDWSCWMTLSKNCGRGGSLWKWSLPLLLKSLDFLLFCWVFPILTNWQWDTNEQRVSSFSTLFSFKRK